jgi:hypothetical protein
MKTTPKGKKYKSSGGFNLIAMADLTSTSVNSKLSICAKQTSILHTDGFRLYAISVGYRFGAWRSGGFRRTKLSIHNKSWCAPQNLNPFEAKLI